mmetsp:Transcript_8917/g.16230  ORF Transcript_8917/g.16230 Transcript_8917/m.16230 type:complete len:80 (+) Transcript_8917:195-434(+)
MSEENPSPSAALSQCLLSQYRLCAAGLGLGAAYTIKYKKGALPFVVGGVIGSASDLVYGLLKECSEEFKEFSNQPQAPK